MMYDNHHTIYFGFDILQIFLFNSISFAVIVVII